MTSSFGPLIGSPLSSQPSRKCAAWLYDKFYSGLGFASWQRKFLKTLHQPNEAFRARMFSILKEIRCDRFNHRRLLEPIGYIPPYEAEARYYAMNDQAAIAA